MRIFANRIGELIASVVLGFLEVLALSMYYRDSLSFWTKSFVSVLIFIGIWLVCAALIFLFFCLIQFLLRPDRIAGRTMPSERRQGFADRHPFLLSVIVLTVFYLPWIIIFYPGSAIYDMMYQTVQADGFMAINAHHPIFATYVIGLCSKIGLWITGRLNLGIFLYILLQTAVCILSFSYMISFMAKRGIRKGFWLVSLGFLAIPPLWGGAMQCGTKDTMFTGLFVFFLVLSARLMLDEGKSFRIRTWIAYGLSILLLCLYRNAILVIMIPTLVLFFLFLKKKSSAQGNVQKDGRKTIKKTQSRGILLLCGLAAIIIAAAFGTVTKNVYHTKTESGEILSLPFQQTARYVRDHSEEMTEEEKQLIETTFDVENFKELGKLYYPMSSDPVKARYHWWASDEEKQVMADYFSGWSSMLKKHPGTYVEAAVAQTYGYYSITPVIKNQKGGAGTTVQFGPDELAVKNVVDHSDGTLSEELIPESPKALKGAQEVLKDWYFLWQKVPVADLLSKCGFYFYILLALTLWHAKRKNRLTLLTVPAFLLILMAIASPVNEHIRYILPAVAALPLMISAAAAEHIKNNN